MRGGTVCSGIGAPEIAAPWAYYNDNDPNAAAWLRELMRYGQIPEGEVDERSILDVDPSDVAGFRQCHFFAGIGGWAYALRLAGWPDDRPVWTGSPPCQPLSVAGLGLGRDDPRHLAPQFIDLVRACRPPVLFGEQVASADVFGKVAGSAAKRAGKAPQWAWLDDVSDRLEAARYAVGASDIPAASLGAPHIRQRTFFGAIDLGSAAGGLENLRGERRDGECLRLLTRGSGQESAQVAGRGDPLGLADNTRERWNGRTGPAEQAGGAGAQDSCDVDGMGDGLGAGLEGHAGNGGDGDKPGRLHAIEAGSIAAASGSHTHGPACPTNGVWGNADWLLGRDAKWRPVEPGTFPLVDGLPGRVGLLRGYGNAIVPQAAAEFIEAFIDAADLTGRLAA